MDLKLEQNIQDEFADNFTLTKEEMVIYDIPATFEKVVEKLRELKIARNKYINLIGYEDIVSKKRKTLNTYTDDLEKKIGRLEIDIKSIDIKIEKLYMDRLDDIITPDTYKKLTDKFEEQKNIKQKEIDELKISVEEYKRDNSIEELLETQTIVKEYLKTRKNPPRELILKIVDRIEIHQDKTVDLHFKLKQLNQVV